MRRNERSVCVADLVLQIVAIRVAKERAQIELFSCSVFLNTNLANRGAGNRRPIRAGDMHDDRMSRLSFRTIRRANSDDGSSRVAVRNVQRQPAPGNHSANEVGIGIRNDLVAEHGIVGVNKFGLQVDLNRVAIV